MQIIEMDLTAIKPYEKNPRKNDNAVEAVAASIREFGFKVPIVIDRDNVIVCGHTRYKAGKLLKLKTVPCLIADDLTDEQIRAFRLADNKVGEIAEWDLDLLDFELDSIDLDMSEFGFDFDEDLDEDEDEWLNESSRKLTDDFIIPPMTVFDTRQGYWQDRKKAWKELGLKSDDGRNEGLLGDGLLELAKKTGANLTGTSIFDPVLCEIAYKWFNIEGGKIYDCFAGGSVRGIVASKLGYDYSGIDLRQEQIDANYKNAAELGVDVKWYCDDSLNADKYIEDDSVDMIFSCPPYADLEVYSDDERDISNMDYEQFKDVYRRIIDIACRKLKNDRFAVFVVGDVRDKRGFYRNFVDYTKQCFNDNGLLTYNDIVLVEQISTAAIRCGKVFNAARKVTKVHQNVLVFYKGDPKNIKANYSAISVDDITASA